MNKAVVIYDSKYGSTRQYAEWIAQALSCPLFERKKFNPQDFSKYDMILYGGGLYAGSVSGIKLISQNHILLSGKKIVLFTCGLASPDDPDNLSSIRASLSKTLSEEMLQQIRIFHLRGAIDYSRLTFLHRSMMSMMNKMLQKKDVHTLSAADREFLKLYGKNVSFMDPQSIRPLVNYAFLVLSHTPPVL